MSKMSAKFVGKKVGLSTKEVYKMWSAMGFVKKDNFGDWTLTDNGHAFGGKISQGSHCPVPTFEFKNIVEAMIRFYKK